MRYSRCTCIYIYAYYACNVSCCTYSIILYIHTHIHICISIYVYIYICTCTCNIYINTYKCIYIYICVFDILYSVCDNYTFMYSYCFTPVQVSGSCQQRPRIWGGERLIQNQNLRFSGQDDEETVEILLSNMMGV